jgi:tetratricopeptide (TPR) repeat protein
MEDEGVRSFADRLRRVLRLTQRGDNALARRALATIHDKSMLSHLEPQARAMAAMTLGHLFHAVGDLGAADKEYKFYCDTIESMYGKNHLATGDAYITYAVFLTRRLQLRRALDYAGQALVIRLEKLGVCHVCTADSHYNLGLLFRMLRRYSDALREFQFARNIRNELLGPESLASAEVHFSLACTHQMGGRFDEAFVHYSNALRFRQKHLGSAHPHSRCAEHLVDAMRCALIGHAYNLRESESALARMYRSPDPTVRAAGNAMGPGIRKALSQRGWFVLLPVEDVVSGVNYAGQRETLQRYLDDERVAARADSWRALMEAASDPDVGSDDESILSEPDVYERSPAKREGTFEVSLVAEADPYYELAEVRLTLDDDNGAKSAMSQHTKRSLFTLLRSRKMTRSAILEALSRDQTSVRVLLDAVDRSRRRSAFRSRRQQMMAAEDSDGHCGESEAAGNMHAQNLVAVPKGYYPILMPEGYFFSSNTGTSPVEQQTTTHGTNFQLLGGSSFYVDDGEASIGGDSVNTARSDDTRRMARRAPQGKAPLLATSQAVERPTVVHAEEGAQTEEQFLEPEDHSIGKAVKAPLQEGLVYAIPNEANRRLKPVAFAPEELWGLGHLKMLAFGLFPYVLQHEKVLYHSFLESSKNPFAFAVDPSSLRNAIFILLCSSSLRRRKMPKRKRRGQRRRLQRRMLSGKRKRKRPPINERQLPKPRRRRRRKRRPLQRRRRMVKP